MNDFEFMNYFPTPNEKYFMGICTVRFQGRIMLKYKVIPKKDGSGYFIASPNYRLPVGDGGEHKYIDAIMIDSNSEKEALFNMMREGINQAINPQAQQQQQTKTMPNNQTQQQNFQPDLNACPF